MNKISIIIPILNESDTIDKLLLHLSDTATKENIAEVIVVDGGSIDHSQEIVQNITKSFDLNLKLIISEKGRAKQMNIGVQHATGEILYFLHADSFPPKSFDQLIIEEVQKKHLAGCFRMQFDSKHWWLRLASWLTQFSWRACRGGDQSQFITKSLFMDIGGYDESYIIYEDNILINELYARNQFIVVQKKIKTSDRRYKKHGVWKLQYHFWAIYVKKWFGATADELYVYYKKHIP